MVTPIRVAVLDDHPLVLRSVQSITTMLPTPITISTSHSCASTFLEHVTASPPDVAVVDLIMRGRAAGHHTIAALTELGIPSIVFTADQRRVPVRLAMQAGARGLVLKADPLEHLARAVVAVATTGWAQSSALAQPVLDASANVPALTQQELECLRLAAEGVPVKAIGRQFAPEITQATVKTYLRRAYEKYNAVGRLVHNTTHAATQAMVDGFFDVSDDDEMPGEETHHTASHHA